MERSPFFLIVGPGPGGSGQPPGAPISTLLALPLVSVHLKLPPCRLSFLISLVFCFSFSHNLWPFPYCLSVLLWHYLRTRVCLSVGIYSLISVSVHLGLAPSLSVPLTLSGSSLPVSDVLSVCSVLVRLSGCQIRWVPVPFLQAWFSVWGWWATPASVRWGCRAVVLSSTG